MADNKHIAKLIRRLNRELFKGMPKGGPIGTPKGKKGYTRKRKHPHREDVG